MPTLAGAEKRAGEENSILNPFRILFCRCLILGIFYDLLCLALGGAEPWSQSVRIWAPENRHLALKRQPCPGFDLSHERLFGSCR